MINFERTILAISENASKTSFLKETEKLVELLIFSRVKFENNFLDFLELITNGKKDGAFGTFNIHFEKIDF